MGEMVLHRRSLRENHQAARQHIPQCRSLPEARVGGRNKGYDCCEVLTMQLDMDLNAEEPRRHIGAQVSSMNFGRVTIAVLSATFLLGYRSIKVDIKACCCDHQSRLSIVSHK
jgi:hypothetical protein